MKKLCLIVSIMAFATIARSQGMGDTVIIYVDSKVEVKIAIDNYKNLKGNQNIIDLLEGSKRVIPEISSELSSEKAELVVIDEEQNVTISPGNPNVVFLQKEGKLINTGIRDEMQIHSEDVKLFITATDLTALKDLPLSDCLKKVSEALPREYRWSKTLTYDCSGEMVREVENKNNEFDMLNINLGAGGNLIRNQWVPDLSAGIGIGINKKGKIRFPYISTNLLFDFTAEGKTNINTFLNLGYGWHFSNETKKKDLLAVEIGYLISQQGDMFGDNTFRLGVNWSPVKGVFVSPQLYLTDDFNSVFPGIRVGFGF